MNRIGIKYNKLIGILDMIIGWFFLPNLESVVDHSSQGRFCLFTSFSQKWS